MRHSSSCTASTVGRRIADKAKAATSFRTAFACSRAFTNWRNRGDEQKHVGVVRGAATRVRDAAVTVDLQSAAGEHCDAPRRTLQTITKAASLSADFRAQQFLLGDRRYGHLGHVGRIERRMACAIATIAGPSFEVAFVEALPTLPTLAFVAYLVGASKT